MMSIIKTAIITIVISFISGILLDYYKNLAPKILCNVEKTNLSLGGLNFCAYIINIKNNSNKTIHELTLNIQSHKCKLNFTNEKITKGLKYDSSVRDNTLDISIPFLSKDDNFSVTVYTETSCRTFDKPIIVLRSPEKFKQIDSTETNFLNSPMVANNNKGNSLNKSKSITEPKDFGNKDDFTKIIDNPLASKKRLNKNHALKNKGVNKKLNKNKKLILVVISLVFVLFIGLIARSFLKNISSNIKTIIPNSSTDTKDSKKKLKENTAEENPNKKSEEKTPEEKQAGSDTKNSSNTTNNTSEPSKKQTTKTTDSKESTESTEKKDSNTESKESQYTNSTESTENSNLNSTKETEKKEATDSNTSINKDSSTNSSSTTETPKENTGN
ncbi:hypothetical protein ACER0A_013775 [Haloimpatiens sp. FM7315]|uniref:hypothetical protein n=1 Tax=Haloimpatiens sp. FM7315 TaxID=3298609 RepID=UPI00370C75D7